VMSADPAALQLRLLQAVVEIAAEKNSTLMLPFPVEMLRFFERVPVRGGQPGPAAAAGAGHAGTAASRHPALPGLVNGTRPATALSTTLETPAAER